MRFWSAVGIPVVGAFILWALFSKGDAPDLAVNRSKDKAIPSAEKPNTPADFQKRTAAQNLDSKRISTDQALGTAEALATQSDLDGAIRIANQLATEVALQYLNVPGGGPEKHIQLLDHCLNSVQQFGDRFIQNGRDILTMDLARNGWAYALNVKVPRLAEFDQQGIGGAELSLLYYGSSKQDRGFIANGCMNLTWLTDEPSLPKLEYLATEDLPASYGWQFNGSDSTFCPQANYLWLRTEDGVRKATTGSLQWVEQWEFVEYPFVEELYLLNARVVEMQDEIAAYKK